MTQVINDSEVNFIYMTIRTEYVVIYRKLIKCLANLKQYTFNKCNKSNKLDVIRIIYECWLMFQSGLAADKLGETDKAEKIMRYVEELLNRIFFTDEDEDANCICEVLKVDEEGILKVKTNNDCCIIPTFYIDVNTGDLMSVYDEDISEVE